METKIIMTNWRRLSKSFGWTRNAPDVNVYTSLSIFFLYILAMKSTKFLRVFITYHPDATERELFFFSYFLHLKPLDMILNARILLDSEHNDSGRNRTYFTLQLLQVLLTSLYSVFFFKFFIFIQFIASLKSFDANMAIVKCSFS